MRRSGTHSVALVVAGIGLLLAGCSDAAETDQPPVAADDGDVGDGPDEEVVAEDGDGDEAATDDEATGEDEADGPGDDVAAGDGCLLVAPEGWVEEPLDDAADPASAFCRLVDPGATEVGTFNEVRWVAEDTEDERTRTERGRPFYEEQRDAILSPGCGEEGVDLYVAFDAADGAGDLLGSAFYVARRPLGSVEGCVTDFGSSSYRFAVGGQVFQLRTVEGVASCQPPQPVEEAAWSDYVDCRVAEFEQRNEQFRTLATVMSGG